MPSRGKAEKKSVGKVKSHQVWRIALICLLMEMDSWGFAGERAREGANSSDYCREQTEIVPGSDENRKELMLCVLIGPTRKLPFNNPVAQLRCWHQKESAHHCLARLRNNRHRRRFSPSAITQKCFSWKGSGFYFQRSIAGKKRRNDENRPRSLCNSSFFMQLWQSGEKLASIKAWWSRNYSLDSPF